MGQRLIVQIEEFDEEGNPKALANAYYHWAAYTGSSFEITEQIIDFMKKNDVKKFEDSTLYAIRALEATNAGLINDEPEKGSLKLAEERYPEERFQDPINRNEGLIEITEDGMQGSMDWCEGLVTINITSQMVDFEVYNYQSKEEFQDDYLEYECDEDTSASDVEFPYDFIDENLNAGEWSFDDVEYYDNLFSHHDAMIFKDDPNSVISSIE